jgi:NhaA family Na+:H+ antiporter
MSLLDWINDFLMSIFFLLVTLELKEEVLQGELSNFKRVILPLICAIGGVIIPIVIYYFFNYQYPNNLKGFAIPTATDIAFAYGIICLFGKKINKSLKVFIISLAIFDDLLAIFFIGFFYSHDLNLFYGFLALGIMVILGILNLKKIYRLEFYIILGLVLWLLILKSSIHPSIAGVVLAIFITHQKNFIKKIISSIAPLVNFMILPIFAFANSAVYFNNFTFEMINDELFLGIFFALALKIPMIPFHGWLPDAHVQAPTGGSMMLAGVLLKLGGYGMIKILLNIFPEFVNKFSDFVFILV